MVESLKVPNHQPIPTPEELIVTVATLATELVKRGEEIKRLKATIKRQKSIIKATADDRQIDMFRDELRTQVVWVPADDEAVKE